MAALRTPLTELLGLDVPIVQAPIGGLANPRLAAAVANAGGLGMLACSWDEPDVMRERIRATRSATDRAFGVNLILEWDQAERVAIAIEERVPVVSFFWGDPSGFVEPIHAAGGLVALTVGSAGEARSAAHMDVDLVVAQGWEAGGHVWGQVATLALVPSAVDALAGTSTPVIAAGGIGDGRGLAAALALGAAGAWLGTRFVMSEESLAHPRYRDLLAGAAETDTVYGTLYDVGWPRAPHRTLANATSRAWVAAGEPLSGARHGESEAIATSPEGDPIVRYQSSSPRAGTSGDIDALSLWAGQSVGLIRDVAPAATIVRRIAAEAVEAIERLHAGTVIGDGHQ